ncbi:hypothetical protein D9M72_625380 [compost metagenome]
MVQPLSDRTQHPVGEAPGAQLHRLLDFIEVGIEAGRLKLDSCVIASHSCSPRKVDSPRRSHVLQRPGCLGYY